MASYNNAQYTYQQVLNGTGCFKKDDSGNFSNGVRELQARLRTAKYFNETPDGIFGAYTKKKVKLFQKDNNEKNGLIVDGEAGQKTLIRLREVLSPAVKDGKGLKGTYSSNVWLTYEKMKPNAEYIRHYLTAKKWSLEAVCALLGNMEVESSINPGKVEDDGSGGYGLVQWTPPIKYKKWAHDRNYEYGNIKNQLKRIRYEAKHNNDSSIEYMGQWIATTDYNMSFEEFTKSQKSAYRLAQAWLYNYERGDYSSAKLRAQLARGWYKRLKRIPDSF